MKRIIENFSWKKDHRHAFHLEKSDLMSIGQLKMRLEQDAWALRRLLESSELSRQNFSMQLNQLVKNLVKSQSYYQQSRLRRVLER